MLDTTQVPEDLIDDNHLLSGSVATILQRFKHKEDWLLTEEEAGIVPDKDARHNLGYGARFEKGEPGAVAANLAERAIRVLLAKKIVIEPSQGVYRLDPHGHLIPNPDTREGLNPENEIYISRQVYPISASRAFSATYFTRELVKGAPILSVENPGVKTGFVIAPSDSKENPWKIVRAEEQVA